MIRDACTAAGKEYTIYCTKARGDAAHYVREMIADKPEDESYRFYACGGDGTLSEVVSGAVSASGDLAPMRGVEVGCIPIGTGNDFVRNFTNVPFFCDITKQILADSTNIDVYRYDDGRYGINMANIGFDCDVVVKAAELKQKKLVPKKFAYIFGVISVLKKNLGRRIRVTFDDGRIEEREFQLVSAANGVWCGGGFHSAPRSSLSDGSIDVSLIEKVTRRDFLRLVGSYKKGTHLETKLGSRVVRYTKNRSVTFDFDEPTNVCVDGEVEKRTSLTLTVAPQALSFVIPIGCDMI